MARKSTSSSSTAPTRSTSVSQRIDITQLRDTSKDDEMPKLSRWEEKGKVLPFEPSLLPKGNRSLSFIGIQAFFLGFVFALSILSTIWLTVQGNTFWRLPAFLFCLSAFHFLEFWTTAHFNAPSARADSFLLFSNGKEYNMAQSLAALEILVSMYMPRYQLLYANRLTLIAGIMLVIVGQTARTTAMAQAGTNFNHTPQRIRREGHQLVTTGIYAWLRHPSYFGFFWWAIGTQVLVGNKICLFGYIVALWYFFYRRIACKSRNWFPKVLHLTGACRGGAVTHWLFRDRVPRISRAHDSRHTLHLMNFDFDIDFR